MPRLGTCQIIMMVTVPGDKLNKRQRGTRDGGVELPVLPVRGARLKDIFLLTVFKESSNSQCVEPRSNLNLFIQMTRSMQ